MGALLLCYNYHKAIKNGVHTMSDPIKDETKVTKDPATPADTDAAATDIKEVEFDGYKFNVDITLLDDVDAFELIDRIENKGQTAAIVPLMKYLIGNDGYADMRAHFTKKDGRFKFSKLVEIYPVILEKFDPKG